MEELFEMQNLEMEIKFLATLGTQNISQRKLSIGVVKRGRTSVCYWKSCAISNHNVIRSITWSMN
jgi:uncharacterized membrane-anchored protein